MLVDRYYDYYQNSIRRKPFIIIKKKIRKLNCLTEAVGVSIYICLSVYSQCATVNGGGLLKIDGYCTLATFFGQGVSVGQNFQTTEVCLR